MPQSSVKSFYEKSIKNQISTEENLLGSTMTDFQKILSNCVTDTGSRAIDLGYGYGNYSIALAQKGFNVTAVDYLNPNYFQDRLKDLVISEKITVLESDLNLFIPQDRYDFVVAKDVFHFLDRRKVTDLLRLLVQQTNRGGWHYIVIFTDIQRKSGDGDEILIESEAKFTTNELVKVMNDIYYGWKTKIEVEEYKERDRSGKSYYFIASRVTICANNIEIV